LYASYVEKVQKQPSKIIYNYILTSYNIFPRERRRGKNNNFMILHDYIFFHLDIFTSSRRSIRRRITIIIMIVDACVLLYQLIFKNGIDIMGLVKDEQYGLRDVSILLSCSNRLS
jgi:hypothetical protein